MRENLRNIKLIIQYDGSAYSGWQIQKDRPTIQGVLEGVLEKITGEKIRIIGAGRTDSGVHALRQVANFYSSTNLTNSGIKRALNALLPDDIVILDSIDVPADFHARKSAKTKVYKYVILNRDYPSSILRRYCWWVKWKLDLNVMREALELLKGRHDFSAFSAKDIFSRTTVRNIIFVKMKEEGNGFLSIEIEGDGFLKQMVRRIVGTLVEVGRGKMTLGDFSNLLNNGKGCRPGPTAPSHGLFLKEVKY